MGGEIDEEVRRETYTFTGLPLQWTVTCDQKMEFEISYSINTTMTLMGMIESQKEKTLCVEDEFTLQ